MKITLHESGNVKYAYLKYQRKGNTIIQHNSYSAPSIKKQITFHELPEDLKENPYFKDLAPTNKYPLLCQLLGDVFGGNPPLEEHELLFTAKDADITEADLQIMEVSIAQHPEYISTGLPFKGDSEHYDNLLKTDKGFQLIQKYMDAWD